MTVATMAKPFFHLFLVFALMTGFVAVAHASQPPTGGEEGEEEKPAIEFPWEDAALLGFFDSNRELSILQRSSQEKIAELVNEHGLTTERFTQIGNAAKIGALDGGAFSNEEIDAFNTVAPLVTNLQRQTQAQMQELLAGNGLSTALYQEIMNEFRGNQELQEYVTGLARERAIEAAREERRRQREAEAAGEEGVGTTETSGNGK